MSTDQNQTDSEPLSEPLYAASVYSEGFDAAYYGAGQAFPPEDYTEEEKALWERGFTDGSLERSSIF